MRRLRDWLLAGLAVLLAVWPAGAQEPAAKILPAPAPVAGPRYRGLRPADCQCRAAQSSSLANLLDRERYELEYSYRLDPPPVLANLLPKHFAVKAHQLRLAILTETACEARNRAAGSALEVYFRIAETEGQADLLDLGRRDLADAIRRSDDLTAQGFRVPVDVTALRRQLLDTEADRARAHAGLIELNSRLKGLTGLDDLPANDWIWPIVDAEVSFVPIDVEDAVCVALAHRAELRLLRTLSQDLDGQTLPLVREYLKSLNGLLGTHGGPAKPLEYTLTALKECLTGRAAERALRSGQLQQLLAERERAVVDEVRRSAANLEIRAQLVTLGRQRVQNAEAHRKETEAKAVRGTVSYLEVLNANLDWYKARSQLVTEVMGWHTALGQLRQAMGLLAEECCPR